jgi:Zn-dependent M16 (insulinase) family peptidase
VTHIIEHTVLCGSDKFPVKDPFVELVKGSLNTFLNAITYPDKTVYPVASCNEKDFQNLMHVYLDAVFHPNIYKKEEIFKQEGWHYVLEEKDGPITINGVVYNEMKGAFSSPEGVLDRMIFNSLFPDTAYQHESGGDPEVIPQLTYEDYLNFHKKYYHPSNSYIYLYGNMDVEEKLRFLDEEYLSGYESTTIDSEIQAQKPFAKPVEVTKTYSLSSAESEEDNTYISYNAVIGDVLDKKLCMAFDILEYALLTAPGAPLKKALLDAGIGKDIMGSFDDSTLQPIFSVVAKNANYEDKERFIQVFKDTLENQIKKGLNPKALLAGINSSEFKFREADFGAYPKGLIYGLDCMESWLYDDDQPFLHLEAIEEFQFLKEQIGTGYFEKLIQEYLLDNKHVSITSILPEKGLNAKTDEKLAKQLEEYKKGLTEEEIEQLMADTKHLKQYQDEPSGKEDLEKIPMLTRADLKKEAAPFQNEEEQCDGTLLLKHEMFTGGITYVNLMFDLAQIPEEDVPYLGLLKAILGYVDTRNYAYADLANEINLVTGGVSSYIAVYPSLQKRDDFIAKFEVRARLLEEKTGEAFALFEEILTTSSLKDEKRIYEILAQVKSRLQMSLSSAGHSVSAIRALSYSSKSARYNDMTGGIALYRLVADVEKNFEEKKEVFLKKMQDLICKVFRKENLMISITADERGIHSVKQVLPEFHNCLFTEAVEKTECKIHCEKKNEGLKDASQVQYVSRAGNFMDQGYEYNGALRILKVILSYDYLWLNIRVKGGAYGCMSGFSRMGDCYFSSYRDPNLRKTNEIFEKTPEYLENFNVDERDMTKYIIGTISDLDTPTIHRPVAFELLQLICQD